MPSLSRISKTSLRAFVASTIYSTRDGKIDNLLRIRIVASSSNTTARTFSAQGIFTLQQSSWMTGDLVVYKKSKVSTAPGPRAKNVLPATEGESYSYTVSKYWIVKELLPNGDLLIQTTRGKEHTLSPDDLCLRRPNFWERWFLRGRFRKLSESLKATTES